MNLNEKKGTTLIQLVKSKLVEANLIVNDDSITLSPLHFFPFNGDERHHYVISCEKTSKKFFLKLYKGSDGLLDCSEYLKDLMAANPEVHYPTICTPLFIFNDDQYFITEYIDGKDVEMQDQTLSDSEWHLIAINVRKQIDLISSIHAPHYSEKNEFLTEDCAKTLTLKLTKRLKHAALSKYVAKDLQDAFEVCVNILLGSTYSEPTLIHMDVKPANIIYCPDSGKVSLIDFEHSRFGDYDYGIIQLLLTNYNSFSNNYKTKMFPELIKGLITFEEACSVPKLQVYLFYQSLCNIIYYYDRKLKCPEEMRTIFDYTLKLLLEEK